MKRKKVIIRTDSALIRRIMLTTLLFALIQAVPLFCLSGDDPAEEYYVEPGFGFGINFLKIIALGIDPTLYYYGTFWGPRLSRFFLTLEGQYADGAYLRDNLDERIAENEIGPVQFWKQVNLLWKAGFSQGLIPGPGPGRMDKDLLTLQFYYQGAWCRKLPEVTPDAAVFALDVPEAEISLIRHSLNLALNFNYLSTSRLFNIRSGSIAELQLKAAPAWLGNSFEGISDFYKFSLNLRNYIPLVRHKEFSMYIYENLCFDAAWGSYIPWQDSFSQVQVRGGLFYDGLMHLSHALELRMSFPLIIDTAVMPGFNIFYDFGFYDDYDYQFSPGQSLHSIGACFNLHLDSAVFIPVTAQLDLQFGAVYRIDRNSLDFYFNFLYPMDNQL